MKINRMISALTALLIALPLFTFGIALAEEAPDNLFGGLFLDETDAIVASIAYENQILVLTRKAFYLYQPGNAAAMYVCKANDISQEYPDERPAVDGFFMDMDKVMGLNSRTGQIYIITVEQDAVELLPVMQLDWDQIRVGDPPDDYLPLAEFVIAHEGKLYLKFSSEGQPKDLFSFDLETGELTAHTVTCLQGFTWNCQ